MQNSKRNRGSPGKVARQKTGRGREKRYGGLSFSRAKPQEREWILHRLEKLAGNDAKKILDKKAIVLGKRGGESEIFLVNEELLPWFDRIKQRTDPQAIGAYLGRMKIGIALGVESAWAISKRAIVSQKAEQLVLYGRDVFLDSALELRGGIKEGDLCVIANEMNEPLALGRMAGKLNIIRNLKDRGEYIRGVRY